MAAASLAGRCSQALIEAVPQVMRALHGEMRRHGAPVLSIPQLRVLAYLHHHPGACLFHVAEHLGVSRPTTSIMVERLVRRRMVSRATDPEERRRVVLALTALGARHLERARQSAQAHMATMLARLSPRALERINEGLVLMLDAFEGREAWSGVSPKLAGTSSKIAQERRQRDRLSA